MGRRIHRTLANVGLLVGGVWLGLYDPGWHYQWMPAWVLGWIMAGFGLLGLLGVVDTHEGTYLAKSLDGDPNQSGPGRWRQLWLDPIAYFKGKPVAPPPAPPSGGSSGS